MNIRILQYEIGQSLSGLRNDYHGYRATESITAVATGLNFNPKGPEELARALCLVLDLAAQANIDLEEALNAHILNITEDVARA